MSESGLIIKFFLLLVGIAFFLTLVFCYVGMVRSDLVAMNVLTKEDVSASVIDKRIELEHRGRFTVTKYYVAVLYDDLVLTVDSRSLYDLVALGNSVDVLLVTNKDGSCELQLK